MKVANTSRQLLNNNIVRIALVTGFVLMVPLLGGWPWTLSDFVIMGVLIFSTGLAYELITKKVGRERRVIVGLVLAIVFFLIWAELAVGLFGSPFAGS